MLSLSKLLRVSAIIGAVALTFFVIKPASAATSTVCGSGCDFTTLTDALASSTSQSVLAVGSTYDAAAEAFPIMYTADKVIDCQSSGAVIGNVSATGDNRLTLSTNTVVRNCSFSNLRLFSEQYNPDGIQILNNTFSTTTTSTIEYEGGMDNFIISGNQNISSFFSNGSPTSVSNGLISDNTFYFKDQSVGHPFDLRSVARDIQILGNTFTSWLTTAPTNAIIILDGEGITFATNTVQYRVTAPSDISASVSSNVGGSFYFLGNKIESPGTLSSCVTSFFTAPNTSTVHWIVENNTNKIVGGCTAGAGYYFSDNNEANSNITIDFNYNSVYGENSSSATSTVAVVLAWGAGTHSFDFNNSYNGFYGLTNNLGIKTLTSGLVLNANTLTAYPFFRTANVTTTDDYDLAPYSTYLDVNGTRDVGAVAGVRNGTIVISEFGTVDYSTVHATNTVGIGDVLRSGDTIQLANGTYAPITVSSTLATTSISIVGLEDDVIIDGGFATQNDGILFRGVTSSSITNVTIRNASSTLPGSYTIDLISGIFGGQSFDQDAPDASVSASATIVLIPGDGPAPSYSADGYDVTFGMDGGYTDWHLALLDLGGGQRITALVPDYIASTGSDIENDFGIPVAAFATSTFIYNSSDQTFAFNQAALDAADITLAAWGDQTPDFVLTPGAGLSGIRLDRSHGITLTHVTSSNNGYGISVGDVSSNVTVSDSSFSGNTSYDVRHESDERAVFDNVDFARTSSTFTGAGDLLVKFDVRILATRFGTSTALQNVSVSSTDDTTTVTSFGLTDASGYTSYVSLPAYVLSASDTDVLNGGFNPYTFSAASSTYFTSSSVQTLTTRNATYSIAMRSSAPPAAPSGVGPAHVSTSTVTLGWIDNADNEDLFQVEYRRPLLGEAYPGTATSVYGAANVDLSGLTPGEQYEFRVAAVNAAATSTYATSSVFTMVPVAAPPVLVALSQTSFSVAIDPSVNTSTVTYALYSSTLGSYLDASGAATSTPVWQLATTWGTVTVSGRTCGSGGSVVSVGRNTALNESVTSSAATVTMSACPVVSSGGGGGGAVGGGGGGSILVFFPVNPATTTVQATSTPISTPAEVPAMIPAVATTTEPVAPTPDPAILNPGVKTKVLAVLKAQKLTASDEVVNRLALFVQEGTNKTTKSLGEGERLALLKDASETMGRSDISTRDLERMAQGEIPKLRSLVYERSIAPRTLATFKTMFGHAPNFKNATENLAWNTLMYRIRFPRDLAAEKRGILVYKKLFASNPTQPFQWAVVRVLGYVQR